MNRLLSIFALCLACLLGGGCSPSSGDKKTSRTVTATTPPQQWILQQLAGNRLKIQSLLVPGANPETFEPDLRTLSGLQGSLLLFTTDAPGFEQNLTRTMAANFPDVTIVNSAAEVERMTGTHSHHDHGAFDPHHGEADETDPHVWTSLRNVRIMARTMMESLCKADPEGAETYRSNFQTLDRRLAALDDSIAGVLAPRNGRAFMVWHPSLAYFARDYGLVQIAVESDGKELTPSVMRHRMDAMVYGQPLVFFIQKGYDTPAAATLARESGLKTAEISPMHPDIIGQARALTHALTH